MSRALQTFSHASSLYSWATLQRGCIFCWLDFGCTTVSPCSSSACTSRLSCADNAGCCWGMQNMAWLSLAAWLWFGQQEGHCVQAHCSCVSSCGNFTWLSKLVFCKWIKFSTRIWDGALQQHLHEHKFLWPNTCLLSLLRLWDIVQYYGVGIGLCAPVTLNNVIQAQPESYLCKRCVKLSFFRINLGFTNQPSGPAININHYQTLLDLMFNTTPSGAHIQRQSESHHTRAVSCPQESHPGYHDQAAGGLVSVAVCQNK